MASSETSNDTFDYAALHPEITELQKDRRHIDGKKHYKCPDEWNFDLPGFSSLFKVIWNNRGFPVAKIPPKEVLDRDMPVHPVDEERVRNPPETGGIQATWIGHATFLIQMEGVNFLTDPVFSERASPMSWAGPKRYRPTPCDIADLPTIDFVLVSHNHYDHLDLNTIKQLGDAPTYYVPPGTRHLFESAGATKIIELDWWRAHSFKPGLDIVATPCQHWSNRKQWDKNTSLWASFCVVGGEERKNRFYFSGDTGYCPAFKDIGRVMGPFTLAAIPIGAYEPRWFMRCQHVNPEEAVKMHIDLRARRSVGMHWGTFNLTSEDVFEPPSQLATEAKAAGLKDEMFFAMAHGETTFVSQD